MLFPTKIKIRMVITNYDQVSYLPCNYTSCVDILGEIFFSFCLPRYLLKVKFLILKSMLKSWRQKYFFNCEITEIDALPKFN